MNFDHWFTRTAAYVAFGLFVFVATLLITFPDGRIAKIAAVQIEGQLENRFQQNVEVNVDDFDLWWLWGGELEGVTIEGSLGKASASNTSNGAGASETTKSGASGKTKSKSGKAATQPTPKTLSITVGSVAARLAPITSILNQALAVDYHLGIGEGTISGTVIRGTEALEVTTAIDTVKLNKIKFLEQYTNLPFFGELSGDIQLSFLPNSPIVKSGSVEIDGNQLTIGPKPAFQAAGIPIDLDIPSTNLGNLTIRLNIKSPKPGQPEVQIDTFNARGRDIQRLQAWGKVDLGARLNRTQFRLTMRTKFRSEFINKNNLGPLLQIKQFRNGQRDDWYGFILVGYLNNLTFKGAAAATAGPSEGNNAAERPTKQAPDSP